MTSRDTHGEGTAPAPPARVNRRLTLRFDRFGWESLEAQAAHDGESLDESLERAFSYFAAMVPTTRVAALAPRFKPRDQGTPREISIELTRVCWGGLEDEAERRGIPLEQLLEHAALLHLSDADSGEIASHVLERADEADEADGGTGGDEGDEGPPS